MRRSAITDCMKTLLGQPL